MKELVVVLDLMNPVVLLYQIGRCNHVILLLLLITPPQYIII